MSVEEDGLGGETVRFEVGAGVEEVVQELADEVRVVGVAEGGDGA